MRIDELTTSNRFVRPSNQEADLEHSEVQYQLNADHKDPHLPDWVRAHLNKLRDKSAFRKAVSTGKVRNVSPQDARNINNTGDHWNDARRDTLEKGRRVEKLFKSGQQITTPMVLHNPKTNEKHLLGGHHRLTYNSQVNKKATPVLHLANL
jgi:hypothetical protein